MDWENQLFPYEGCPIKVWIEDRSGEQQTQPKPYTLYKVLKAVDQPPSIQFYLTTTQYLSVPVFDEGLTYMVNSEEGDCFVSHDVQATLFYRVFFEKKAFD